MVHLIPGIGGTQDMWRDYRFPFPARRLEYFAPPSLETSFEEYAALFAARHGIEPGDTIIGMSLGGLLGGEISRQLALRQLILVSSGTSPRHISPLLRSLDFLGQRVPFRLMQRLVIPTGIFGPVRRRTFEMFKASDPLFLNWACARAARWPGLPEDHPVPVRKIHGAWDPVFPLRRQRVDIAIPRAGHITLLRQPEIINPVLIRWVLEGEGN
jgi:pimeloyl-ACP methyl ester carboxylesterase